MTPTEIRNAVCTLQAQGHSLREISRSLALSRNTVRRILRQPNRTADEAAPCDEATLVRLKAAFERACGNVVRVQELLADDGLAVRYSTLTRWAREAGLRSPPRRAGEYDFAPGQEMQHDTSPHRVLFKAGTPGKIVTVQCAGLVLAYSRRLFIQYYPRFTRFEAKAFLLEAVRFMDGVCPVCIIDNTSVLLAAGAGAEAGIPPEILAFARTLGLRFRPKGGGNGQHLRGNDSIGPGAGGEQDAGIVDDADRADAIHEANRLKQECFGLEAGEPRVVLNEQPARVGQHQPGALDGNDLAGRPRLEEHAMRRGVVLHLLSGREVVFAGAPRRTAQARFPGPTGQCAVAHRETVVGQQFLDADHVATGPLEGGLQPGQCRFVAGRRFVGGSVRLTQDAPHGIARQRQAAADLAQAVTLCLQSAHRITDLGRGHARRLAEFR